MRNLTPSWMLPTGLLTLSLIGCGQQDPADAAREKVVLATDLVAQAHKSATGLEEGDRVYTKQGERQGVTIPADYSAEAFEQDRLNAMVPGLEAAATGAGPLQQYTLARTLSSIHRQDAHYLAQRGADSFRPIRSRLIANQVFYQQMQLVNQRIAELQANRDQIIQTLQTGEMGQGLDLQDFIQRLRRNDWGGEVQVDPIVRLENYENPIQFPEIEGVEDIQQRESNLESEIDQTRQQLVAYLDEIDGLLKEAAKNSELSQQLVAQASELNGSPRFEKLDQAIRVQYQAMSQQTQAETQIILAKAQFNRMGLSLGDMIDDKVVTAIYNALSRAGNVPAASSPDTFTARMPQAMLAFGQAGANVKSAAFAEYQALLAQDADDEQAANAPAQQRGYFDQQVDAAVAFATQFQFIQRGSDVAGTLAAMRAVLDASRAPGDLANLRETIAQIQKRIAQVRAEQDRASADLQKSQQIRTALIEGDQEVSGFLPTLEELDAQMQVLVMQRYAAALESIAKAEQALTGATPTSTLQAAHAVDLLSAYVQHVRIQHDYLVALHTYRALLQSYIAQDSDGNVSAQVVLTDAVVEKLQELTAGLDEQIAALRADASTQGQSLRNTVRAHLDSATAAAGTNSSEAEQIQRLSDDLDQLWRNMTGGSAPAPQPEPADSEEPVEITP